MSQVQSLNVADDESELRLDRWFRRRFPTLPHGRLEKLLRTGQVRVDGKRAKSNQRLEPGQVVRVPPLDLVPREGPAPAKREPVSDADARWIRSLVIHKDAEIIALNKPPGIAVQGGTGMTRHIDGLLDALRFDAPERPRLVHRLDRDTSGVFLLARNARAAAKLAEAFRDKSTRKLYWALVVGTPRPARGKIDLALAKERTVKGERVAADPDEGKRAVTLYDTVDVAGDRAAWLVLWPLTGRTHQLRVHLAEALATPIFGDRKYGGSAPGLAATGLAHGLHLHARAIAVPHPGGGVLRVKAELPKHMQESWRYFGFEAKTDPDPFPAE
jgi:23S rRNA pseudouridine955/2504/2580 synthase